MRFDFDEVVFILNNCILPKFAAVCVATANGKELCHLHDGEYFGEIEMALKNNKVKIVYCKQ